MNKTIDNRPKKICHFATVLDGHPLKDTDVVIMIEFDDGDCVVDLGEDLGMDLINIKFLRPWIHVQKYDPVNGHTYAPEKDFIFTAELVNKGF